MRVRDIRVRFGRWLSGDMERMDRVFSLSMQMQKTIEHLHTELARKDFYIEQMEARLKVVAKTFMEREAKHAEEIHFVRNSIEVPYEVLHS